MKDRHEIRGKSSPNSGSSTAAFVPNTQPRQILARLISQAQEKHGNIVPDEVLKLAATAKDAVESLLLDMEQADRDALQEAVLETFLVKGN